MTKPSRNSVSNLPWGSPPTPVPLAVMAGVAVGATRDNAADNRVETVDGEPKVRLTPWPEADCQEVPVKIKRRTLGARAYGN